MYSIFYELSFCGDIENREEKKNELKDSIEEINKAKEEGRLDEIMVPWEDVKERLNKKIEDLGNKKNGL